jgi:hypothetical protein
MNQDNQDNQGQMVNSQSVKEQLNRLEENSTTNVKNKKGSTNEIQPMATDDGLTQ